MHLRPTNLKSLFLVALLASCGTPYTILKSTDPGPLDRACNLEVAPVGYVDARVGKLSETDYIQEKQNADEWADKKTGWERQLNDRIRAFTNRHSGSGQALRVVVNIDSIETGFYAFIAARPGRVRARAKFLGAGDELLYEIETEAAAHGASDRIGRCYNAIGAHIVDFLTDKLEAGGG